MHQPVLDPMIHQPVLDPISPFRRSSFGIEASLKTAPTASSAAQAFKEMLSQSNRPIPSRRASLRGVSHAPSFPAPPPPPMSVTAQVVDPTRLTSMLESHATTMRPPSPIDPARTLATSRKVHHSPVRSPPPAPPPPPPPPPPTMSSPLRRNSSQAEYFMRSNGLSPPIASKRTYSFVRDQSLRPPIAGQHRAPPARSGSCPPDADIFKTRTMRSNSDGYNSASTSFVTEGSTSPTSSSSNPSDSEDIVDPHRHLHDKKAPEPYSSSFNLAQLELESRRRDLLWRETEKLWKDKHGNTLSRAEDMSFRQKVESGLSQAEDGPQEREWRDMWKTTDSYWNEFEARWRKDLAQRRTTSRNDDGHFHTVHSDSRDMTSPDDDNAMASLMSSFERAMGDKRQAQRLSDLERAERKRREHEHSAWKTTLEHDARRPSSQGPEQERLPDTLHRPQDRLLRPDPMRTRSSSVVVEGRPNMRRSRSGSVAAMPDVLPNEVVVDSLSFETVPRFDEKPPRMKRNRPSRGSKDGFEFLTPELDSSRAAQTDLYHADELKQQYLAKARHNLQEELRMSDDSQREEHARAEKIRRAERRDQERRGRDQHVEAEPDFRRSNEATQRHRDATSPSPLGASVPLQPQPSSTEQASPGVGPNSGSIQEHLLKLEAEQAALARRIQELRMAAEAAANVKSSQAEPDRGREREHEPERDQNQKTKAGESRPKVQDARKRQSNEADVFKAMQDRLRKAGEQKAPERVNDFPRKAKRSATLPLLDHGAPITPTDARPSLVHSETEPVEGRVHFLPTEQSSDEVRSPIPVRPRTPGPKVATPARIRTPSPRSQSPTGHSGSSSIASSNATRDTSPGHEAQSSVHEAVAPRSPKPQPSSSAHTVVRPAGKSREAGPSAPTSERPKSGTPTAVPVLNVPPHVNTSAPPIEVSHNQDASPVNAKTPRASAFDPDRTPRAQACPVPETSEKAEPTLAPPPVYISPSQSRARAGAGVEEETTKRRVDAAVGATVAAAAAEAFDRAGGRKRGEDAERRAQEERRASEEQLAKERRRAEEERRAREHQRAEEARKRDAAERRDREEQARLERERRERQEREERGRRWGEPTYERASRPPLRSEPSIIDAWNSYELRWSALSVASSTQPINFRNIPWPLLRIPNGPESITPQAVGAFLLSPVHSQDKSRKERLRSAMLRWHSDKFEGRWMARIDESERAMVKEAVGAVARSLTELMTKPDLY